MNPADHHVVVLGASPKPHRYANQAQNLLVSEGYRVSPVHPVFREIDGLPVFNTLGEIGGRVDTLTLYVGPQRLAPMIDQIVDLAPARVIFNPGTESPALESRLDAARIPHIQACTLVMLRTGTFLQAWD